MAEISSQNAMVTGPKEKDFFASSRSRSNRPILPDRLCSRWTGPRMFRLRK